MACQQCFSSNDPASCEVPGCEAWRGGIIPDLVDTARLTDAGLATIGIKRISGLTRVVPGTPEHARAMKLLCPALQWSQPNDPASFDCEALPYKAPSEGLLRALHQIEGTIELIAGWSPAAPKYDPEYRAMSDQLGDTIQERDAARMCVTSLENRVKELESYTHGLAGGVDRLLAEVAHRFTLPEVKALLAALARERDEALKAMANARSELETALDLVNKLTDWNCSYGATNERLRDEIAALTAEKNALQDALAQRPAPVPVAPEIAPNPFRDFPGDRRKMGQ